MKPQISILMPAFNAASFLTETLQSIVGQTLQEWELIIINDFSNDETQSIIDQWLRKDLRIKSYPNTDKGIISALRLAYGKAQGEYITRMDADDVMPPNKLSVLLSQIKTKGLGYVATAYVKYIAQDKLGDGYRKYQNWLNERVDKNDHFEHIYTECVIPSPCWLMHRDDLDRIGAFDFDIYPEDYDLVFRMYKHGLKVWPVKETLHIWRDHDERSSRNDPNYADNRFLALKMYYWLTLDHDEKSQCVVWGAGKKGKYIAKRLAAADIDFNWLSNNPKKIGHNIYGCIIKDAAKFVFTKDQQVIVAVAVPSERAHIIDQLQVARTPYFSFC